MTAERSVLVAVPRTREACDLVRDIVSAAERSQKADPGDRGDIVRYEALCVQLESLAHKALAEGSDHFASVEIVPDGPGYCFEDTVLAEDDARLSLRVPGPLAEIAKNWVSRAIVVELRLPLEAGATATAPEIRVAPGPSERWETEDGAVGGRAVEQRFRAQLDAVVADRADDDAAKRDHGITPSGVHNRVLTQVLREYVVGQTSTRVDAPVTYRDGSQAANAFPVRCLPLASELPTRDADLSLHLALLSIRHTEMDPVVDGAWLRNAEVSRPRPAALTDDFVYDTSMTQLDALTVGGTRSLTLHVYQTGLDTAVVGFYRAVVDHLLTHPYSLSVVPMFHASGASTPGLSENARFRSGKPWTLGDPR